MTRPIVENRITLPENLEREYQENEAIEAMDLEKKRQENQAIETMSSMSQMKYEEIRASEMDKVLQSAMTKGHLTSYFDQNRITLPDRVITNRHMKSVWFLHSEYLGLENPCVLSFNFGREYSQKDLEEQAGPNQSEIQELLQLMGCQAYLWCTSEKLTIFAAKATGRKILPESILDDEQESESGYFITPDADPGKVSKRFKVNSAAPGVLFDPQPSIFPMLHLGGELPYRVGTRDSKTVGDGGLCCPQYIADEILKLSGAPLWGDIIAFQIVVIGADYSFKGLCNIVPNRLWQHEGIDLLVDQESINRQLMNRKVTLGKIMPTRHKDNKRYFYVEPMNLGEVVNRFTDPRELAEHSMAIAQRVDLKNWTNIMETWKEYRNRVLSQSLGEIHEPDDFQNAMSNLNDPDAEWDITSYMRQAKKKDGEELNSLKLIYQESKESPFGSTSLVEYLMETWKEYRNRVLSQSLGEIHEPDDFQNAMSNLNDPDAEWDITSYTRQAKKKDGEELNSLKLIYQESKGSPFGFTSLVEYLAAGPSNSWKSQLNKSRRKGEQWEDENDPFKRKKSTLTGIMVSGEKLILMDPGYAGVTYPRKGYVRLIWHPYRKNQLMGIALSISDTLEFRDAFDGMDVDGDIFQMIPIRDRQGKPNVLLMRSPMSVDGGAMLRLNLTDAKILEGLGYHFYRQTGEHKYPGLHQVRDGEQIYPDVLKAVPHAIPPKWTTDPEQIAFMERSLNRYKPIMGMVCLAAANLDYAGLYDPSVHKFVMSEAVIDPSLNASADPTPVLEPLLDTILEAVHEGKILDRCMFPRIAGSIKSKFKERYPGEEFRPLLDCPNHHKVWRLAQESANAFLYQQNMHRASMANGPTEWLMRELNKKLLNLVTVAVEERAEIWKQKREDEKAVRQVKETDGRQKDAEAAVLLRYAKEDEASLVQETYRKASETIKELKDGEFIAAWIQVSISRKKRFESSRFGPVRASGLLKLPQGEIRGYLNEGESQPTVVIRASEKFREIPGTKCFIEEREDREGQYWLVCEEDGQVIADLSIEARNFTGMDLAFEGFVPRISVTPQEGPQWEQAENLVILRATSPGKI